MCETHLLSAKQKESAVSQALGYKRLGHIQLGRVHPPCAGIDPRGIFNAHIPTVQGCVLWARMCYRRSKRTLTRVSLTLLTVRTPVAAKDQCTGTPVIWCGDLIASVICHVCQPLTLKRHGFHSGRDVLPCCKWCHSTGTPVPVSK